jgi:aryl-alcohol dehydrogenase-like predicted oxidoreductase
METVPLGSGRPLVSRVGLGLMSMSGIYGPADENESVATIRAALDAGVTLLDTAGAAQLAIAWVLSRGKDIIPLIGTKRRDRLAEALGALDLELDPSELAGIEAAIPAARVAGDRYDPAQMAALDSEKS